MLIKGTLKGNLLSTETGDFHIATQENWPDTINGVFELSKISSDSFERQISVEGYVTIVKIPIVRAEITQIYVMLSDRQNVMTSADDCNKDMTLELSESLVQEDAKISVMPDAFSEAEKTAPTEKRVNKQKIATSPQSDLSGLIEDSEVTEEVEVIELFGKPLSELGDTYQLDHSVGRDVIRRIFQFFQKKGIKLDAKTQSFNLKELTV